MLKRTVLLTAVLVLAAAGGPAVGLAGADVTLEIVVESNDGATIGGAEVTASWDDGSTTGTTASNGRVFIDVPDGADVTIEVDHADYVRNDPYELTNADEEEVTVTVWEKASATVSIVDGSGPVEGVQVVFEKGDADVGEFTTDSQGVVESGTIESGEYELSVFKAGYLERTVILDVNDETSEEIRIERGSVTVTFTALDDHFDPPQPIAGATIAGPDFSTATQPDGQRSVSVPVNTELAITLQKEGYETVEQTVTVGEEDRTVNVTTRRSEAVNIEVFNEQVVVGETVQVAVTDEYGEPLPDATVSVDETEVGQPDADGTLRIVIESRGEHVVSATDGRLTSEEKTVIGVIPAGEASTDDTATSTSTVADATGDNLLLGDLRLRSTAIGIAGGLVLAAVLFVVLRFR